VEAIASIHGSEAEIIEFNITKSNRVTKHPISELHIPSSALIAGVLRDNESIIPHSGFQLQRDDKVIVLALPEAIPTVEKIFH